jgi:hypothetical protein
VTHHENTFCFVQANRHSHLLENEILLEVITRRRKGLRTAGHNDHVATHNILLAQKLTDDRTDAIVETAEHRGIRDVWIRGRVEVEDLSHIALSYLFVLVLSTTTPQDWKMPSWDSRRGCPFLMACNHAPRLVFSSASN